MRGPNIGSPLSCSFPSHPPLACPGQAAAQPAGAAHSLGPFVGSCSKPPPPAPPSTLMDLHITKERYHPTLLRRGPACSLLPKTGQVPSPCPASPTNTQVLKRHAHLCGDLAYPPYFLPTPDHLPCPVGPEVGSALQPPGHQASLCFLTLASSWSPKALFLSMLPPSPLPCGPCSAVLSPIPSCSTYVVTPPPTPHAAAPRSPALTPTSWTFPSGDPAAFSSRIPFRLPDPFHLTKDCRISVLELYLLPHPMGAHGWAILPTRHLSSPSLQRCPSPRPLVQTKSTHRRQASCWGTVPAGFDCIKCAGGAERPTRTKGFQGVGAG